MLKGLCEVLNVSDGQSSPYVSLTLSKGFGIEFQTGEPSGRRSKPHFSIFKDKNEEMR